MAFLLSSVLSSASFAGINDGLVGYWNFDGNANDSSGNGNNGIVNGATLTADRLGKANSAYQFDGQGSHIVVADSNSLHLSTSTSFSMWFKTDSSIDYSVYGSVHLLSKGATYGDLWADYAIQIPKAGQYGVENTGSKNVPASIKVSGLFTNGTWTHIAVIYQNSSVTVYENGVKIGEGTTTSIRSSTEPLYFGLRYNGSGAFKGAIDDIRIYNRSLSAAEVMQLATDQTGICDTTTPYNQGYSAGQTAAQAACKANPSSCGITVSSSGSGVTTSGHASYTPSSNLVHIPYLDAPTLFGGTPTVYEVDLTVMPNTDPLQLKLQNAKQVQ